MGDEQVIFGALPNTIQQEILSFLDNPECVYALTFGSKNHFLSTILEERSETAYMIVVQAVAYGGGRELLTRIFGLVDEGCAHLPTPKQLLRLSRARRCSRSHGVDSNSFTDCPGNGLCKACLLSLTTTERRRTISCIDCGLPRTPNGHSAAEQNLVRAMKQSLPTVSSINIHKDFLTRLQRIRNLALFESKLDELVFVGRPRELAVQGTWTDAGETARSSMRRFDFSPTSTIAFHVHHAVALSATEATKLAAQTRDFWNLLFQHGFVADGDQFLPFLRGGNKRPHEKALLWACSHEGRGWQHLLTMNRDKRNKNEFICALNALRAGLPCRALVHIMADTEGSYKLLDAFLGFHGRRVTETQMVAIRAEWRHLFMVHIRNARRPAHDKFELFRLFCEEIGPAKCGWQRGD